MVFERDENLDSEYNNFMAQTDTVLKINDLRSYAPKRKDDSDERTTNRGFNEGRSDVKSTASNSKPSNIKSQDSIIQDINSSHKMASTTSEKKQVKKKLHSKPTNRSHEQLNGTIVNN